MRHYILIYFFALLLALPICGFGQTVPVAPGMLLDIGGSDANVYPADMKSDAQGNTYVMGNFRDEYKTLDFDPSAGVTNLELRFSGYIAKYSAAGALIWVKPFTGEGNGLDIDRKGNITIIGQRSPNKPVTNVNSYLDAFLLHLDNNGNLLWEKLVPSGSKDIPIDPNRFIIYQDEQTGYKVASDDAGNLIAVYTFGGSPDVDGIVTARGSNDGLVVKYDTNGNVLWKFNLGAVGAFTNSAIETMVDKDNNIIVAGYTNGMVNYNPLGAPYNVTAVNTIFIAKYSPAGILQWIKTINANSSRNNIKLALDGQDNIYINGSFNYLIDFGVAPIPAAKNAQDLFIAKYSSGGDLLYHKSIGGSGATMLNAGLATGLDNSLYLIGNFTGKVDVDPSPSVSELHSNGTIDMFMAKYDDNGNYQWAFRVQGIQAHNSLIDLNFRGDFLKYGFQNVTINSSNEILVSGAFQSTVNFNGTGCGVNSLTAKNIADPRSGLSDMFMVRYTPTIEIPITNNTATAPVVTDICLGVDPGVITGSTPVGGNYTYQWQLSLDNKTFTDIPDAISKDFDPPVIAESTYYRRRLITSECAVSNISNVITITLLESATPNTITAPAMISFCNAGDASLIRGSVPKGVGNVDYQWQQSTDNISFTDIKGATTEDYDPELVVVTTHYRRLITNIPCNLGTPSNTVTITVMSVPIPTVSAEQTVCIGDAVTLIATGGIRYLWSPAAGLSRSDVASPTAAPTVTTSYRVTVFNANCSTSLQVKVIVIKEPTVNAGADKLITKGDKVQLNAQVGDAEGATYSWTPTTYLDNPTIATPVANPTNNITYRLTVKSANGCFIVSDEVAIAVQEKFVIPNAFSPNGDGINDILNIPGLDTFKQSTLTIFNRNGQQIFKSVAYPKPWDGTHNGKSLPTGTYYYIIELNDYANKRLSGSINLLK